MKLLWILYDCSWVMDVTIKVILGQSNTIFLSLTFSHVKIRTKTVAILSRRARRQKHCTHGRCASASALQQGRVPHPLGSQHKWSLWGIGTAAQAVSYYLMRDAETHTSISLSLSLSSYLSQYLSLSSYISLSLLSLCLPLLSPSLSLSLSLSLNLTPSLTL